MKAGILMMIVSTLLFHTAEVQAQKSRADVADRYKWDLNDLYESDEAWTAKKSELTEKLDYIDSFKGKLASSADVLLQCLEFAFNFKKELNKLYMYAKMNSDLDTRNSNYQAKVSELQQLDTQYKSMLSFLEPEILAMDSELIERYVKQNEELDVYEFYLKNLQRRKAHLLSKEEEKIIAEAGLMAENGESIFSIFYNAELPYPEVTLSSGETVTLTPAGYARHRANPVRADRELVFDQFFGALKNFKGTMAAALAAEVNSHLFTMRARGYSSCLESALDANNIPADVYLQLIRNVNDNTSSFHRYLDLKRRMLGVDQLKYSDLYAPTVEGVDLEYSIEEAYDLVLQAFAPLGADYLSTIERAMENRWIDVYPTIAKKSGAYSWGDAYDVHPFILLNYNDAYQDVSTLAHELGHTMHSFYSNKNQPYPLADYSIFVAEVASTFNEALLMDHMLNTIEDDNLKLSLMMEYLDNLKGTVFRQTQFAEFELKIHEMVENGTALTGDSLTELYGDIVRRYYGHDQGVCKVDDLYAHEWSYIPHFYYNFYVYQYATSFTASTALAEKVLEGEQGAVDRMITFLSSGGSDYPIELLKQAGVDMTTSAPFDQTMVMMNRIMDEIERILDRN